MNVLIRSFGPISEFRYDLSKDIVVTYGDNNIGKSYAMQVVYLLLKNLTEYAQHNNGYYYSDGFYYYSYSSRLRVDSPTFSELKSAVERFADGEELSINITELMNSAIIADITEKFISNFINSCENTFGNFKGILEQNPIVILETDNYCLKIEPAKCDKLSASIYSFPTFVKRTKSNYHKSRKSNDRLDIYYSKSINATLDVIADTLASSISDFAANSFRLVGNVYFLPASRSGIYSGMSAFSSIIAELSKNKAMLTKKIELPGISEPISDYFLMLSNIRMRENNSYSDVYKEIENDIIHGTVKFNRSRNTLVYIPDGIQHEFEMTEVSSMVSEISPIVAFLKYIVTSVPKRNKIPRGASIVFIEEPEAHLHPKNQIKLIELFSKLCDYNIKIVVSSHSNYIFSKLNNLLLSSKISPSVYSAILLQQEEAGSISTFMQMDELGVDDTNFLDSTQALYDEREALISELNSMQD